MIQQELSGVPLRSRLGMGATGMVYLGVHATTGERAAIKILRSGASRHPAIVARFEREAAILRRLQHPHIVRPLAADRQGDRLYLALEFVDGLNLNQLLEAWGPLPVPEACRIVADVAAGLQAAWELGLVHRDIKPSNVMVDWDGQVKILDLGLALACHDDADDELTLAGQALGTAA